MGFCFKTMNHLKRYTDLLAAAILKVTIRFHGGTFFEKFFTNHMGQNQYVQSHLHN